MRGERARLEVIERRRRHSESGGRFNRRATLSALSTSQSSPEEEASEMVSWRKPKADHKIGLSVSEQRERSQNNYVSRSKIIQWRKA